MKDKTSQITVIQISQWKAKGAMADFLIKKKKENATLTSYIKNLIIQDMQKEGKK